MRHSNKIFPPACRIAGFWAKLGALPLETDTGKHKSMVHRLIQGIDYDCIGFNQLSVVDGNMAHSHRTYLRLSRELQQISKDHTSDQLR